MNRLLVLCGLILLFTVEILRVYFIMPFPGSQQHETVTFAWFLSRNIFWMRLAILMLLFYPLFSIFSEGRKWQKILLTGVLLLYGTIFYFFNYRLEADKMFYPPKQKLFASGPDNQVDSNKLVIGVNLNGEAKAYPIELIGYHHQVRDTLGGQQVWVTYCTVCRTGRVYNPQVNGRYPSFRLVGMDHFNALFEDNLTGSWWQQENGLAVTGPLKGRRLRELPSAQMRLGDWIALHPDSRILQPDPNFRVRYDSLKGYDEGTLASSLERRDTGSWQVKSWVIGITLNGKSKAYDWNRLLRERLISDSIGKSYILLTLAPDNRSYFAFIRPRSLAFRYEPVSHRMQDDQTHSTWNLNGTCLSGPLATSSLVDIQAYQEFWYSWRTFHPETEK